MADDISILIGVETAPVRRAVQLMDNLEAEVRGVEKAEAKGLITRKRAAIETQRLNKEMEKLKRVSSGSAKDFSRFEKTLVGSGKAARRTEIAMQQAGYQFQDFIVQVQGGVNPLIAFSQQGSQLAGFFAGPWGAMIGLGIAAVSSLAMAFMSTGQETREFQDILDDTETMLGKLSDANKAAAMSNKELEDSFGSASIQIKSTLALLRSIAENEAQKAIDELASSITSLYSIGGAGERRSGIAELFNVDIMFAFTKSAKEARKEARILTAEFLNAQDALSASEGNIKNQIDATQRLLDVSIKLADTDGKRSDEEEALIKQLSQSLLTMRETQNVSGETLSVYEDILGSAEGLNEVTEAQNKLFGKLVGEAEKFLSATSDAANDADKLSKIDIASGINAAAIEASELSESMKAALLNALGLVSLAKDAMSLDPFGGEGDKFYSSSRTVQPSWEEGSDRKGSKTKGSKGRSGGGGKSQAEELSEYLQKKQEEAALQEKLLGLFGEERDIQSELISAKEKYNGVMTTAQANELEATLRQIEADKERQRVLEEAKQQQEQLASMIANQMGDAFMSIVDGTKSVKDAFKDMARAIIKELYQIFVVKKITGFLESAVGNILPSADGNVFSGGSQVKAYANGGVVGGPTYFPMSGGKTGLMGEAGPEAIMPLKRGANGKLGVQMEGGGGDNVVINQSFNFQANGDDSVKKLIAQAAPQIAQMTQKQIMDSRRRGGAMKSTFG